MKIRILFMMILISSAFPYFIYSDASDDSLSGMQKSIEFSIGGSLGLGYSRLDNVTYDDLTYNYYKDNNIPLTNPKDYGWVKSTDSLSLNFNIPLSFIIYFSQNFGFGFNFSIGDNIDFSSVQLILYDDVSFKFKLVNKFGKFKNAFFLFEYGINLTAKCYYNLNPESSGSFFFIGPSFFLGFEKQFKNFSFIVGANYETMIRYSKQGGGISFGYSYGPTINNSLYLSPNVNIEARFSYIINKIIK